MLRSDVVAEGCACLLLSVCLRNHCSRKMRLTGEAKQIVADITAQFDSLKEEFRQMVKTKDEEIQKLTAEVGTLRKEVDKCREEIDSAEQYERRDTLVISGNAVPTFVTGEISSNVCRDLIKEKLRIEIKEADISTAHRIGKKPRSQQPDKRNLIMKLCRRDLKSTILQGCREVKPNDLYIHESLTPLRSKIVFALRGMKREPNSRVKGVSTSDGRVFAWVSPTNGSSSDGRNLKIAINTAAAIQNFSLQYMQKPVSEYVDLSEI